MAGDETLRIDKLLWFLRFAGSRNLAQEWVAEGHIRLNGRRIERASTAVRCGDVLVLPLRAGVKVITVGQLPRRRGPVEEARGCYEELDAAGKPPLARADPNRLDPDLTHSNPEGPPLP